jgi:hypothetical protein
VTDLAGNALLVGVGAFVSRSRVRSQRDRPYRSRYHDFELDDRVRTFSSKITGTVVELEDVWMTIREDTEGRPENRRAVREYIRWQYVTVQWDDRLEIETYDYFDLVRV